MMKQISTFFRNLRPAGKESEEKDRHIPNQELLNCILEVMWESAPQPWYSAMMVAAVGKDPEGKNLVSADFTYKATAAADDQKLNVDNWVAPMNAAKRLQDNMAAEGNVWSTVTVILKQEGGYEVTVK